MRNIMQVQELLFWVQQVIQLLILIRIGNIKEFICKKSNDNIIYWLNFKCSCNQKFWNPIVSGYDYLGVGKSSLANVLMGRDKNFKGLGFKHGCFKVLGLNNEGSSVTKKTCEDQGKEYCHAMGILQAKISDIIAS